MIMREVTLADSPKLHIGRAVECFRQRNKMNSECYFNAVRIDSWTVTSHHMAYSLLHVTGVRCVAHNMHTVALLPLECACCRQCIMLWVDCQKRKRSRIAPVIVFMLLLMLLFLLLL